MPQRPNGIDQTNKVYGSRKELLGPAWQLINELLGDGGGAGVPAKQVLGSELPSHRSNQPLPAPGLHDSMISC